MIILGYWRCIRVTSITNAVIITICLRWIGN
jgi:hypothetical protein